MPRKEKWKKPDIVSNTFDSGNLRTVDENAPALAYKATCGND